MASSYTLVSFTDTSFTAREQVSQTNTGRFDIRQTLTDTLNARFAIRQKAVNPASFTSTSFDTDSFVSTDQIPTKTFRFDLRGGNINAHVISKFNIREAITGTLTSNISIVGEILKSLTVRIGLAQTVSNLITSKFDLRQAITRTSTNKFHIRETVGKLGSYMADSFTSASYDREHQIH
jgi:hypothetical protein